MCKDLKRLMQVLKYVSLAVLLVHCQQSIAACSNARWTVTSKVVAISALSFSGPADAVQHGALLAPSATGRVNGWRYEFAEPTSNADCLNLKGRFQSLGKRVPGVQYVSNGQVSDVWESGVPGIGYAILIQSATGPEAGVKEGGIDVLYGKAGSSSSFDTPITVKVALVVTGRLATGSYRIPTQNIGRYTIIDGSGRPLSADIPLGSVPITVAAQGCKVVLGDGQTVTLPRVITYDFKEVGATSAVSSSFSIGLKCDTTLAVHATLTDANDRANMSTALSLAPGSTASGFGLQIFRDKSATPIAFGPESSTKNNPNQWLVGTANAYDTLLIPFTVKYVKTAPKVGPGVVHARTLITFSYQ
ncbi:type 1 fimbrial protein [Burkholderia multivorans]|nr:type 1 fimbrial protein [Burkholderia multivorans]